MFSAALLCAAPCCNGLLAAEPAVNAEAYSPLLTQPSNGLRFRVAQNAPAQPGVQPGQPAAPAPTGVAPTEGVPGVQSTPGVAPAAGAPPAQAAPTFQQPATVVVPAVPPQVVVPPQQVVVPPAEVVLPPQATPAPVAPTDPFLEGSGEELPILDEYQDEQVGEDGYNTRRGVRPYGGGRPYDWDWGCNGSPYRTHGMCDDWKVGCKWHVTVDGMVMSHEDADLDSILDQMPDAFPAYIPNIPTSDPATPGDGIVGDPTFEQFEEEAGARITLTSQVAKFTGWDLQFVYEGIPEWNSSIVYPKQSFEFDFPLNPVPAPPDPFPEGSLQRRLHYRSALHSAEMNVITPGNKTWRPTYGVRYFRFDDEINDFIDHEAQPPLAGPRGDTNPVGPSVVTDRLNLFDIQNNLIGAQIGLLHDTWRVNRRLAIEGVVNGGVYYNRVKYTNLMGTYTTQVYADNTSTLAVNEARIDFSDVVNNDVREYSEISYHGEASLTGVCRLNKCWALRGGYQALWIANVHLAEDAYLGDENVAQDLFFHGWHAGIECRR